MHKPFQLIVTCILAAAGAALSGPSIAQVKKETPRQSIRVMSFNIRFGFAKDGDNHWDKRKQLVVNTIRNSNADIIGTQETCQFQAEFLDQQFPEFTYVGRSRENNTTGEQCGILFRTSRFDKLIEGHFWLSESPDQPGSKSWDSSLPRMATWVKLWDRVNQKSLYLINTHFDHRGSLARLESAKLIRRFLDDLPHGSTIVVTGDFNTAESSKPYSALFADIQDTPSPVVDTFRSAHPVATSADGTFNGFKGTDTGARIDWIGASRSLRIQSAKIDKTSTDNRFPSDHFPVTAELVFQSN